MNWAQGLVPLDGSFLCPAQCSNGWSAWVGRSDHQVLWWSWSWHRPKTPDLPVQRLQAENWKNDLHIYLIYLRMVISVSSLGVLRLPCIEKFVEFSMKTYKDPPFVAHPPAFISSTALFAKSSGWEANNPLSARRAGSCRRLHCSCSNQSSRVALDVGRRWRQNRSCDRCAPCSTQGFFFGMTQLLR